MILTIKAFTAIRAVPQEQFILTEAEIKEYSVVHGPEKKVTVVDRHGEFDWWSEKELTDLVKEAGLPSGTYDVRMFANDNHLMSVTVEVE